MEFLNFEMLTKSCQTKIIKEFKNNNKMEAGNRTYTQKQNLSTTTIKFYKMKTKNL